MRSCPTHSAWRKRYKADRDLTNPDPQSLGAWRYGYLAACRATCRDLDAELEIVREAFKDIAGKRGAT